MNYEIQTSNHIIKLNNGGGQTEMLFLLELGNGIYQIQNMEKGIKKNWDWVHQIVQNNAEA